MNVLVESALEQFLNFLDLLEMPLIVLGKPLKILMPD